jgi:hypothetical protein
VAGIGDIGGGKVLAAQCGALQGFSRLRRVDSSHYALLGS